MHFDEPDGDPDEHFLQWADPFSGAYVFLGHLILLLLPDGE